MRAVRHLISETSHVLRRGRWRLDTELLRLGAFAWPAAQLPLLADAFQRWLGPQMPRFLQRNFHVLLTVLVGGALSIWIAATLWEYEQREVGDELRTEARARVEVLRSRLLRSMEVLHSIVSFHAARGELRREEFHQFVSAAIERQPELQAITWDPRVPGEQREAWEQRAQLEGLAGFQFTEANSGGKLIRAQPRAEYFPAYFLEPLEEKKNVLALGYDIGSEKERRVTLEAARDFGAARATGPIRLAQEWEADRGFLVLQPLYDGSPRTVDERRAAFQGFAVAVFRIGDLADAAVRRGGSHVRVALFDAADRVLLHGSGGALERSKPFHSELLDVAGRQWLLTVQADAGFHPVPLFRRSWTALAAGLLITGLLAAYLHSYLRRAAEIERRVREATHDLSAEIAERKRIEEALQAARGDLEVRVQQRTAELAHSNDALLAEVAIRKEAEATAEAASRAKSEFLANISHEIRTPMNAILGYSQILARDASLHPFHRDAVTTIAKSGRHLLRLLDELLDLSKIDAGRMEVDAADFDLSALGYELAGMFQQPAEVKQLGLRLEGFSELPRQEVNGDAGKLRQVLINLLGNAVKFTESGRVTLKIRPCGPERFEFEVSDTGPGIAPEIHASVFEPFHQGPAARGHGGTGLGLAIAKRQVELMGGALQLRSTPGCGSTFFFELHLPASDEIAGETDDALVSVQHLAPGHELRVLIVDRIRENRDVLSTMLGMIGCEIVLAENSRQALEAVAVSRPDIVFLDMRLPESDALEAARTMLRQYGEHGLKVVATSASILEQERDILLAAGCDDFVAKPFRCERIFGCLKALVGAQFVHRPPENAAPKDESIDLQSITLPEDLSLRLMMAAELHSATVLKVCLNEMAALGPAGQRLADHLRQFMASYDMETILKIVAQIPVAPDEPVIPS